jgi:hypothetical protein
MANEPKIALAPNGDIVMTGTFTGTANFGGSDLIAGSNWRIYLVRLGSTGGHIWSQSFPVGTNGSWIRALDFDVNGNIYATGTFNTSIDFGGPPITTGTAFLVKLTSSGAHLWSKGFSNATARTLAVMPASGDVFVGGNFINTIDLGGGPLSGGGAFVARFDTNGNHAWSKKFGSFNPSLAEAAFDALELNSDGELITVGNFMPTIDFGVDDLASQGSLDMFVTAFTPDGNAFWTRSFGSSGTDYALGLSVDAEDELILVGIATGAIDFGGGAHPAPVDSFPDIAIAKFTSGGEHRWSRVFASPQYDVARYVMASDMGAIVFTGTFSDTIDFGGGELTGDMFLAKLGP